MMMDGAQTRHAWVQGGMDVLVSSGKWNAPYVARVVKVMKRKEGTAYNLFKGVVVNMIKVERARRSELAH